jgi:hypothetical protein
LENEVIENHVKNLKVLIPLSNILDNKGLQNIKERTVKRFNRFQLLSEGIEAIVDTLQKKLNIEIEYDPERGMAFKAY